jgi:hypothetical protein
MERTHTRHQVPRSSRPDAEKFNRMYLIKNVSRLRATYQIRLLAFKAVDRGLKLILQVPASCEFSASLDELISNCTGSVWRESRWNVSCRFCFSSCGITSRRA